MPPRNRHVPAIATLCAAICTMHVASARADEHEILRGQRMLSAALASSAIEHSANQDVSTPRTPEQQLLMFVISPRYNAYLWAHPETLPYVVDRAVEPGFLLAAYQATWRPEAYLHFLSGWTDIEKLRAYFELVDPNVIVTWATTASDPTMRSGAYTRLSDAGKLARWVKFAMGGRLPDVIEPAKAAATYTAWLSLSLDARMSRQLRDSVRVLNPAQHLVMANAVMDAGMHALQRFVLPYPDALDP